MEAYNTLFCSPNFPRARDRISSKYIYNFGIRFPKSSPALTQGLPEAEPSPTHMLFWYVA
jgi:hypothetical protein